jgi:SHS2 domain-containing protein
LKRLYGRGYAKPHLPYRFLPDVALADIAFEVDSPTLEGLFEDSARALTDVMVDPDTLSPKVSKNIALSSEDLDRLLYDFLTELIIIKDTDSLLWKEFDVKVDQEKNSLECKMRGEPIDRVHHALRNDAKAVTMHLFGIKRLGSHWVATVVLDI